MSDSPGTQEFLYAPYTVMDGTGRKIDLIEPAMLALLPTGTKLTSINGREVTVGVDYIDDDTRGGMLAFGLPSIAPDKQAYSAPLRTQ